jgi:uncharacterized cupredoxin-like copper-binding protein
MKTLKLAHAIGAFLVSVAAVGYPIQSLTHEMHGDHGHESYFAGEPGDPKQPSRTIEVVMGRKIPGMFYRPDLIEVHQGEQIRFILKNIDDKKDHEFVLASREEVAKHKAEMAKNQNMEHNDPNAKSLKPLETKELLWRFTHTGEFEFACNIPGHREAGMVGKVFVK